LAAASSPEASTLGWSAI